MLLNEQQLNSQQQMFNQLSAQFKTPLRTIIGEAEEAVQTTISNMIQQMIGMNGVIEAANTEAARLRKLCLDNKIEINPKPKTPPKDNKIAPVVK